MSDRLEITITRKKGGFKFDVKAGPIEGAYHQSTCDTPLKLAHAMGDLMQNYMTPKEYNAYLEEIRVEMTQIETRKKRGF